MQRHKIRMVKPFKERFLEHWGDDIQDFMKEGWETWTNTPLGKSTSETRDTGELEDGYLELRVLPEDNRYNVNFPQSCFEAIEE